MKKIINLFLLGALTVGLSSCLKDKSLTLPDADGAISNVIEFANPDFISSPTSSNYPVYVKSYDIAPTGKLTLTVNYAGVNDAPQDINVVVALDPAVLTAYNAKIVKDARDAATELGEDADDAEESVQSDLIEALDPDFYSVGNLNLVIPAGQRTATLDIDVKPDQFSFDKNTGLAFKIVSSSTGVISGNFGSIIVKIGAKNMYDGVYTYKTSATTALRANVNEKGAELVTSGPNTVTTPLVNYYTHPNNLLTYSIDPVTYKVTVLNGGIGVPITDPSSNYDPATKVLYVKWSAGTRNFEETYTYTGSR